MIVERAQCALINGHYFCSSCNVPRHGSHEPTCRYVLEAASAPERLEQQRWAERVKLVEARTRFAREVLEGQHDHLIETIDF